MSFMLVQLHRLDLPPEDISIEEITNLPDAIRSMCTSGDAEDLIQFFEGLAFGFL